MKRFVPICLAAGLASGCAAHGAAPPNLTPASRDRAAAGGRSVKPHASSVVLVIMQARAYERIVGDVHAPFVNGMLVPQAALMTDSHAIAHPSQPNYLALFSGSTQGITDESCPHRFAAPNLGAEVLAGGGSFAGYSESMPRDGYRRCKAPRYVRAHNAWVDFENVPNTSNLVWYDLPRAPVVVSIIVPNLCNGMTRCDTQAGDNWLKANLPSILQYDAGSDGLLILTWDQAEPDPHGDNHIATMLFGPMIVPGRYAQTVNHYAVLHTMEAIAGVACTAKACDAPVLRGMWQ